MFLKAVLFPCCSDFTLQLKSSQNGLIKKYLFFFTTKLWWNCNWFHVFEFCCFAWRFFNLMHTREELLLNCEERNWRKMTCNLHFLFFITFIMACQMHAVSSSLWHYELWSFRFRVEKFRLVDLGFQCTYNFDSNFRQIFPKQVQEVPHLCGFGILLHCANWGTALNRD